MSFQRRVARLLEGTGVTINGTEPWDIRVNDGRFYGRVLSDGSLGLGESYMDEWWDCERIDELVARLLRSDIADRLTPSPGALLDILRSRLTNLQTRSRSLRVGEVHYDAGNDLYRAMLDKRMTYTCAYWKNAATLDEAQEAKLDLVCRKIGLRPGQRVLDIGCGWGSFAKFAAERYGTSVVGITISREQVKLGQERCQGLPVELRFQDYRSVNERFDHIVSLGMIEHVGYKNYSTYFKVVQRCLSDDGMFLLQSIGSNVSRTSTDPWIGKYIFPNSLLPSPVQLMSAIEGRFVMEDWHNFSADYDKTLMAWAANVEAHWSELGPRYGERFRRMWRFYLLSCAGTFRARKNQLWQIVFSKRGVPGGYESIR